MYRNSNLRTILNLLVATAFTLGVALPTLTAERPAAEGGWVAHSQLEAAAAHAGKPANVPHWKRAYAARFPGCSTHKVPLGDMVVVDQRGRAFRADFATIWTRTHNAEHADDVWVLGWCER